MTPVVWGRGICDTIRNSFRCATTIERSKILLSQGTVAVDQDSICFRGRGWHGCLPREAGHPDWRGSLVYVGTLTRPWVHVLWLQFPEGSAVRLVDVQSGAVHAMEDLPVPSPDGRRLLIASGDLEAQYSPNRLAVWRWEPQGPVNEWQIEPTEWEAREVQWLNDSSFSVTRVYPFVQGYPSDTTVVRRAADGWRLP